MPGEVIPDRATSYGERVRRRLTDEMAIWLTTVGRDGSPQPNPVGFLWDGAVSPHPRARLLTRQPPGSLMTGGAVKAVAGPRTLVRVRRGGWLCPPLARTGMLADGQDLTGPGGSDHPQEVRRR